MTPNEKTSLFASIFSPRTCSGDMYDGVPMMLPVFVRSDSTILAMPKFHDLHDPGLGDHDVVGLDVAVEDAVLVRVVEPDAW